jgi:hypothetical protein
MTYGSIPGSRFFSSKHPTSSGVYPASYSVGMREALSWGEGGGRWAEGPLTLPNALYAIMACTEATLPSPFLHHIHIAGYIKSILKKEFSSSFNSLLHGNCWHTLN